LETMVETWSNGRVTRERLNGPPLVRPHSRAKLSMNMSTPLFLNSYRPAVNM
jgi:hypothetical protein